MAQYNELLDLLPKSIKQDFVNREKMRFISNELTKDMTKLKSSGEIIDKYPCYSLFAKYFLTPNMMEDFKKEAQIYIKNNFSKLSDYHKIHYVSEDYSSSLPNDLFASKILNCLIYATNEGDEQAKNILIRLYKKYYKKEYNKIKHFNILSEVILIEQANLENSGHDMAVIISRLIVMSELLGKELDNSVDRLRLLLQDVYLTDKENNSLPISYEIFTENNETGPSRADCYWEFKDILDNVDEEDRKYFDFHHLKQWEFHKAVLNQYGFTDDHLLSSYLDNYSADETFAEVLYLLRNLGEEKSFEYNELQEYSLVYNMTSAYCKIFQSLNKDVDDFWLNNQEKLEEKKENLVINPSAKNRKEISASNSEELDTLRKQIEQLQKELHKKEQDISHIRNLYEDEKKKVKESELNMIKYEQEHDELLALREHIYNLTEQDNSYISEISIEEMTSAIKKLPIAIIGGNVNWIKKMKSLFPDYKYIRVKESSAISDSVIDNVDKVYFFSDSLSHCTYNRFMNIVLKKDISFGYIHTVNLNAIIKQIYEDQKDNHS